MTVRWALRDDFGADDAARAAAVVDDDLLSPLFGQTLADAAGDHVVVAPRREGDDETSCTRCLLEAALRMRDGCADERGQRQEVVETDAHGLLRTPLGV